MKAIGGLASFERRDGFAEHAAPLRAIATAESASGRFQVRTKPSTHYVLISECGLMSALSGASRQTSGGWP
jgi:hypothetical protein